MAKKQLLRAEKLSIVRNACKSLKRQSNGTYAWDEIKKGINKQLGPIDVEDATEQRARKLMEAVSQEAKPTYMARGFFQQLPGGWRVLIDPNRFVVDGHGGVVEYLEARPEVIFAENQRELDNARRATKRADAKAKLCDEVRTWEQRKIKDGWKIHAITMGAFHKENPWQEGGEDDVDA